MVEQERLALQVLCLASSESRREVLQILHGYRFCLPMHQVVFDLVSRIEAPDAERLRLRLQQRLVLAGFPGLEAGEFFQPHGLDPQTALARVKELAG